MSYRTPGKEKSGDMSPEEVRTQLERLAFAGKSRVMVDEQRKAELSVAAKKRAAPARFRRRVLRGNRYGVFAAGWIGIVLVLSLLAAAIAGDLAAGVVVFLVLTVGAAMTFVPMALVYMLFIYIVSIRDARDRIAWTRTLPFAFRGYEETLSLDHGLDDICLRVGFVDGMPEQTILSGLFGHVEPSSRVDILMGTHQVALMCPSGDDDEGAPVAKLIDQILDKVVLPTHAAFAVAFVEVTETGIHERLTSSRESTDLRKLLDEPAR